MRNMIRETIREAFAWFPNRLALMAVIELVLISLALDIWSVLIR